MLIYRIYSFSEMARIGESKKIIQLWHIVEEQILVILCGKQRHVR